MAYRNKTYVAFASENINSYWLMRAWREHQHIDFDFFDAHDINTARDSSLDETIRRRLRVRLANTKQAMVLLSDEALAKSKRPSSFFYYELEVIAALGIPVVLVNINGLRSIDYGRIPAKLASPYVTVSVSFQAKIIQHALDNFVAFYATNAVSGSPKIGPHYYPTEEYARLGL